eukprot:CCRYP_020645-RB/>CCRYP_020645-RB protein AED:0.03 eAED:0.03 QI:160/1/1/1/1/1/5/478/778
MKTSSSAIWAITTAFTFFSSPVHVAIARRDPWHGSDTTSSSRANNPQYRWGETVATGNKVNLLIKYKPRTLQQTRHSLRYSNKSVRLNMLADIMTNVSKRHKIARVEIAAEDKEDIMFELMMHEDVEMVEEEFLVYTSLYESSKQNTASTRPNLRRSLMQESQQIGVDLIQAPLVWSTVLKNPDRYNHTSIKVCIIDTGYDYGHEDLPTSGVTSTETIYGSALTDGDGHGTHCAGVIGAIGFNKRGIVGVNPDPEKFTFHISKALNAQGVGTASSLIQGIEGCISSGSKVISMSVGGGPNSSIFRDIYKEAYDEGILIVAAAGNDGTTAHDYPASFPHVVSVGAVDQKGLRADFSNYNDQIEVMAPGVNVLSTAPNDSYNTLTGTSMSTPYVAGVAALVWSCFPECSNNQIRNVLALTAKRMAPNDECDEYTGFGLIQAKKAFDVLDRWGCEAPGEDPIPLSDGGIGGCAQALPDFRNTLNAAPTSRPTPKLFNNTNTSNNNSCNKLQLDLLTDSNAIETSWVLEKVDSGVREKVKSGPPSNMNYSPNTRYSVAASNCLGIGTYEFTIFDMFGDGIVEQGYYSITLNGQVLASNSNFGKSESTNFTIGSFLPRQPASQPTSSPTWRMLFEEEFDSGLGKFITEGREVLHKNSIFGRKGVAFIQVTTAVGKPFLLSDEIEIGGPYTKFKVALTYRTAKFDNGQVLCIEYSPNNATMWNRAKCWSKGVHFENGVWNDDASVFKVEDQGTDTNSLQIRIIVPDGSYMNRVFIDNVTLSGMI